MNDPRRPRSLPQFLPLYRLPLLLLLSVMLAVPTSALSPDEAYSHEELRGIFRAEGIDFEELAGTDGTAAVLTVTIPAAEADERSPGVFILAIPLAHAEMPGPADGTGTAGLSGDGGLPDGSLPLDIDTGIRFMRKMRARGGGRKIVTAFLLPGETALSLKTLYGAFVTTTILDTAAILENNENTLLVYLDVTEGAGEIGIYHGTRGSIAPLSLVRPVPALLAAHGISPAFPGPSNTRYRLGLAAGSPALEFARTGELPAIELRSEKNTQGELRISAEELAGFLADYAESVETKIGIADTNYTIIRYKGRIRFVSEGVTLFLLLFSIGIVLALFLLKPRTIPGRRRWADICGASALGFVILELLGMTVLDTTWALILIWAMDFTFLGGIVPYPPLIFGSAILAPLATAVLTNNGSIIDGDSIRELLRIPLPHGTPFTWEPLSAMKVLVLWGTIPSFILLICRGLLFFRSGPKRARAHSG